VICETSEEPVLSQTTVPHTVSSEVNQSLSFCLSKMIESPIGVAMECSVLSFGVESASHSCSRRLLSFSASTKLYVHATCRV